MHLGYEIDSGDSIDIPITHTVITGQTRYGKSETVRALAPQAVSEGHTVLLFDVKRGRDYATTGTDIPVYLEESTDPRTLKGLLEAGEDISINVDLSEMIDVCERGDDYQTVYETAKRMEESDETHPVDEKKLRVIRFLLEDMIRDMESVAISDALELDEGSVNVMDLHDVSAEVQQIAIAASCQYVLDHYDDVIVGIDEAHNFMPQSGKPPANAPIERIMREGAQMGVYGWIVDQTITGIDKDPLKQVDVWLIGRQREKNEAGRARDQIPSSGYSTNDLMNLRTGEFVVSLEDSTPLVYVKPAWMDDDTAKQIATRDKDMDDIDQPEPTPTPTTNPETDSDLEQMLEEREERIRELRAELDDRDDTIAELESKIDRMNDAIENYESQPEPTTDGTVDVEDVENIEELIQEALDDAVEEYDVPDTVTVDRKRSKIIVTREVEAVETSTEDRFGRAVWMYASGHFPDGWFGTGDLEGVAEQFGWGDTTYKRTDVLNRLTQSGFLEMKIRSDRSRRYRVVMSPDEAKERGLLEVDEAVV